MVTLDGHQLTKEDLQKRMNECKSKGEKIVEVSKGVYKTLKKLNS